MMYVWLIVGFVFLIKGADLFVDGSSSIAKLLKVPSVVIGLTIVALGTSAPEAAVSVTAGIAGSNELAISNVIGSNAFNLLMVVGVCAIIKEFSVNPDILKRDFPINIAVTVLLVIFLRDLNVSRLEGCILFLLLVAYIVYMVISAVKNRKTEGEEIKAMSPVKSILAVLVGITAVVFGGDLVVDNASLIAASFGLSQTLIGLTIVAIGTSLPELVTSVVAAGKGESGLALGNVVGSNLFNIMFILGMSSAITPIQAAKETMVDVVILLVFTVMVFLFCKSDKKVKRMEGIFCVLAYAAYTAYIILR
ncbi:MAG: calcium/sodium antiporter [Roseburia sp.]|nr:calcium/sodium antiporter [Roseburia sp.]MCM1277443.1 calcium/sodium antiporter [Robinsoniella sp.]